MLLDLGNKDSYDDSSPEANGRPPKFVDKLQARTERLTRQDQHFISVLQQSRSPRDWEQRYVGVDPAKKRRLKPLYIHVSAADEHSALFGGAGGGKTSFATSWFEQGIIQTRLQLTLPPEQRPQLRSFLVIDMKPELSLFHLLKHAAERPIPGVPPLPFKWVWAAGNDQPTYLFQPFAQKFVAKLLPHELGEQFAHAAGFSHSAAYGEAYFGFVANEIARRIFTVHRLTSLADIERYGYEAVNDVATRLRLSRSDIPDMRHILMLIAHLARIPHMRPSLRNHHGLSDPAILNGMDMTDLRIAEVPHVHYIGLRSTRKETARVIGSLAFSSAFTAAEMFPGHRIDAMMDEAPVLAGDRNVEDWIARARSADVSLMLISQSLSQWGDAKDLIINSTSMQLFTDAKDKDQAKALESLGGTEIETRYSYHSSFTEKDGISISHTEGETQTPHEVPAISRNEMNYVGHRRDRGWLCINRQLTGRSFGQYREPVLFERGHSCSLELYTALKTEPIPSTQHTYVPSKHPELIENPWLRRELEPEPDYEPASRRTKRRKKPKPARAENGGTAKQQQEFDFDPSNLDAQFDYLSAGDEITGNRPPPNTGRPRRRRPKK